MLDLLLNVGGQVHPAVALACSGPIPDAAPSTAGLPAVSVLPTLIGWAKAMVLVAALLGGLGGAALLGVGSHFVNSRMGERGRNALGGSLMGVAAAAVLFSVIIATWNAFSTASC